MLHEPKKAWERHRVPVSINFKDDRGKSTGALHLDFPNDPLQFPCYALFLDPANALIIRSKEFEPFQDDPGKGYPEKPVPKSVLSTEVVQQNIEKYPQLKGAYVFKALSDVIRIGVAAFVINHRKSDEDSEEDDEDKPITMPEGELDLNDVLYASGAESWGPVTREDPKVWVTIV